MGDALRLSLRQLALAFFSTRHGAALALETTQTRPKVDGGEASPSTTKVTLCLDLMLYLAMNDQIIQHRNNLSTLGRCEPQRLHSLYGFPAFSRDFPESSRFFDDLFAQCGRGAFVPAPLVSLRPLRPSDCRVPPPMWIGYIELRYVQAVLCDRECGIAGSLPPVVPFNSLIAVIQPHNGGYHRIQES